MGCPLSKLPFNTLHRPPPPNLCYFLEGLRTEWGRSHLTLEATWYVSSFRWFLHQPVLRTLTVFEAVCTKQVCSYIRLFSNFHTSTQNPLYRLVYRQEWMKNFDNRTLKRRTWGQVDWRKKHIEGLCDLGYYWGDYRKEINSNVWVYHTWWTWQILTVF